MSNTWPIEQIIPQLPDKGLDAAVLPCQVANIAGIFGMNFEFALELERRWGYFIVLGVMAGLAVRMVI